MLPLRDGSCNCLTENINKGSDSMLLSIIVPLKVMGIGIVISYGIACLIKALLVCIRVFTKGQKIN